MKHLLGIEHLAKEDIYKILDTAKSLSEINSRHIKKVPTLKGQTIVNFFAEPSTRTRLSFEVAEKRLSADTYNISVSTSSITKGETIADTALNIQAMNPDAIVIRHSSAGIPKQLAAIMDCAVVNAGDGYHEHPTQALLDAYTILQNKDKIEGLNITLIGDVAHSRVARSNIYLLKKLGAKITLAAPQTMLPRGIERMDIKVSTHPSTAVKNADVVMMLRIQNERASNLLYPNKREYAKFFSLKESVLENAKSDAIVMHPGPANRGVEIDDQIMDGPRSVILDQVSNGVSVRMAILYLLLGGNK